MNSKQTFLTLIIILVILILYKLNTNLLNNFNINECDYYNNLNNLKNDNNDLLNEIENKANKFDSFSNIWSNIYKSSTHQQMIKPEIISKTLYFMLNEVDELEPSLINFVKTLINKPSAKLLNLTKSNEKYFSQKGEDRIIDQTLNKTMNGFFIEAGGYDGETYSNSLFFELERGWTGVLIEPIPVYFQQLLTKNRKIFSINACIAKNKPMIARFRVNGAKSGRFLKFSSIFSSWFDKIINGNEYVYVPCFSLQTIMAALSRTKIDFFSLDLEGGEWDVLSSIDLNKLHIKLFVIEHLNEIERREKMKNYLLEKNYKLTRMDDLNMFMLKD